MGSLYTLGKFSQINFCDHQLHQQKESVTARQLKINQDPWHGDNRLDDNESIAKGRKLCLRHKTAVDATGH